jgi:hypothetical protein
MSNFDACGLVRMCNPHIHVIGHHAVWWITHFSVAMQPKNVSQNINNWYRKEVRLLRQEISQFYLNILEVDSTKIYFNFLCN